jgi:hypothetical protein
MELLTVPPWALMGAGCENTLVIMTQIEKRMMAIFRKFFSMADFSPFGHQLMHFKIIYLDGRVPF